jgi:pilus assembly protein Flp/PilA
MVNFLKNLHKDESGQDLIEYALIGLIVALGAIAGMGTLASSINSEFSKIASHLS